jgi:hypothetical protein
MDTRFPALDLRTSRTAIGNRNMLKHFSGLQYIWDTALLPLEYSVGKQYDYVMIVKDDTLWLNDFVMDKLLAVNPSADAYVLSCNARSPPLMPQEICDHGIVIKRPKAAVIGRYLSSLLAADLEGCHESVRDILKGDRGCNSEMIMKWIFQHNNITVQKVPQSLYPFERAVAVRKDDGTVQHCFHKFCQSKEEPLQIPDDIRMCRDLDFHQKRLFRNFHFLTVVPFVLLVCYRYSFVRIVLRIFRRQISRSFGLVMAVWSHQAQNNS